ncbi:hypothetical protein JCM8208_007770 [Rhodotorula glutinis]
MSSQHPYGSSPYRPFSPAKHLAPLASPSSSSSSASGSAPSTGSAHSPSHSSQPPPTASTSTSSSSSSSSQMAPPSIWRTSAFSPQHSSHLGQTRMRARSIGKGSTAPPPVQPHLSPTIPGSPAGGSSGFDTSNGRSRGGGAGGGEGAAGYGPSPLARQRSEHGGRVAFSGRDFYDVDDAPTSAEGTEESGSTRSDSPPPRTPRDAYPPGGPDGAGNIDVDVDVWVESPSRRNSDVDHHEREAWRTGGEPDDEALALAKAQHDASRRNRSQSLEGVTRMSLRRGRSFTSLVSPVAERKDPLAAAVVMPPPIFEQYEPPPTPQVPSSVSAYDSAAAAAAVAAGDRSSTSLYPPATGGVPLVGGGGASDLLPTSSSPKSLRDFVPQLVILLSLFVSSFAVIAFTISTLPGLFLPHSVADLPALTATLTTYRASSYTAELHLFAVLTLLFLWKQCFSIPGSVLTNILFGALYGTSLGTWWACLWTALGSTGAYAIALVIAPLVEYYFAKPLDMTRRALKLPAPGAAPVPVGVAQAAVAPLSSSDLFSHLLLARFFPLLPYSVLNVISGVLRLPLTPFFITLLLGSFPFNFATVSIGNLVALAAADPSVPLGDKIWSREVVVKLVAVTLVSVVPLAFKDQLKRVLSSGGALERAKDAVARALFGFGAVPHVAQPVPHASSAGNGPRAWRRKLGRSIGGAGDLLLSGWGRVSHPGGGGGEGSSAAQGWGGYRRVPLEGATGVLDEAEMGAVH